MKRSSGKPRVDYDVREARQAARTEKLQASHQPILSANAQAAVSCALTLREEVLTRAKLGLVLAATSRRIEAMTGLLAKGAFVPEPDQLDLTESVFELALASTRTFRGVVTLFWAHVRLLEDSYERARVASPVAAFRALRAVSRDHLADPAAGAAWRHVLLAWGRVNKMAPKVALLGASVGSDEMFKFDEETREWKHQAGDGSWVSVDSGAAYAVAR